MKPLFKTTLLFALALTILAIPLVVLFDLQEWVNQWLQAQKEVDPVVLSAFTFGLLAVDIFLPIPASAVITIAGDSLGLGLGIVVCWAGMCFAATAGYWFSRILGQRFTHRLASKDDFEQVRDWQNQMGALVLLLLRPIPVLSEASVLAAGICKMSFPRFLLVTSSANLVMVAVFCLLGHWAGDSEWMLTAVILALLIPLGGLLFVRKIVIQRSPESD